MDNLGRNFLDPAITTRSIISKCFCPASLEFLEIIDVAVSYQFQCTWKVLWPSASIWPKGSQTRCLLLVLHSSHKNKSAIMAQNMLRWEKQKQAGIYRSALMKCTAGVADFLTLAGRKYGCWELQRLANHCHTTSQHRRNYQRKTNGAIDSLVVYLQPSPEKK